MRLCVDCQIASEKWLDSKPSLVSPGIRIASGAAYDDTAAGMAANKQRRHDDWRALVKQQLALISDICKEKHR